MIYAGDFFDSHDKRLMTMIRSTNPDDLGRLDLPFHDDRLPELFFRYRARNFKETLGPQELNRWNAFRRRKFEKMEAMAKFNDNIQKAYAQIEENNIPNGVEVLSKLQEYVNQIDGSLMP